jgi:hypothetical protein
MKMQNSESRNQKSEADLPPRAWEIAIAALCFVCVPVFGVWWERRRAWLCVAVIVALLWGAVAAFGEPQVTIKSDGSRTFVTVTSTNHVAYVLLSSFDLEHWHELTTVHRPAPRMTIELFPTAQRMFFKVETLAHEH